jgi:hypothetical protein
VVRAAEVEITVNVHGDVCLVDIDLHGERFRLLLHALTLPRTGRARSRDEGA